MNRSFSPDAYTDRQRALIDSIRRDLASGASRAAEASRPDFEDRAGRCLTSLIEVPTDVARRVECEVIAPLRALDPSALFYEPEQLHVTLKNVRTVKSPPDFGPREIAAADRAFRAVVPGAPAFSYDLEGLVPLPASIVLVGYTDARLHRLLAGLDAALAAEGVPDDKRYFSQEVFMGLVTVARFREPPAPALVEALAARRGLRLGAFEVTSARLVTCDAVYGPESRRLHGEYRFGLDAGVSEG